MDPNSLFSMSVCYNNMCSHSGLKSYGKVVYVFGTVPIVGYIVFATKVLGLFPLGSFTIWIQDQDWSAYIYNAKVIIAKTVAFN